MLTIVINTITSIGVVKVFGVTDYEFNANIRQWGKTNIVLPIPKADVEKLKILLKDNLVGERVRVTVSW
jgi:hypothetical protein